MSELVSVCERGGGGDNVGRGHRMQEEIQGERAVREKKGPIQLGTSGTDWDSALLKTSKKPTNNRKPRGGQLNGGRVRRSE